MMPMMPGEMDLSPNATPPATPPGRGWLTSWRASGDTLVSRGLRYGLLALYIGTVFVVVVGLSSVNQRHLAPTWWANLIGLLTVAVTILPVHGWLHRAIDRLIYDWHDDPYTVITKLHQRLDPTQPEALREIVPAVAATIAATLKLPYVAITTDLADGAHTTTHGSAPPRAERFTILLAYRGVTIGELQVSARRPGETLSANDLRLLPDLARQVGITLYAARLSDALQASREELITAREEERRRIRRDLHDSLGPTLASLRLQLGAVRRAVREQPGEAEVLLDGLRDDVRAATAEIRRLVYDLRPPLLDDHGLEGALRGLSAVAAPATFTLELPEALPPLSAAVEVALYRIATEAVYNVAKHAYASSCVVGLEAGARAVTLTIRDDGRGLSPECGGGIGLTSMRERANELGGSLIVAGMPDGGTCVTAIVPRRHTP